MDISARVLANDCIRFQRRVAATLAARTLLLLPLPPPPPPVPLRALSSPPAEQVAPGQPAGGRAAQPQRPQARQANHWPPSWSAVAKRPPVSGRMDWPTERKSTLDRPPIRRTRTISRLRGNKLGRQTRCCRGRCQSVSRRAVRLTPLSLAHVSSDYIRIGAAKLDYFTAGELSPTATTPYARRGRFFTAGAGLRANKH